VFDFFHFALHGRSGCLCHLGVYIAIGIAPVPLDCFFFLIDLLAIFVRLDLERLCCLQSLSVPGVDLSGVSLRFFCFFCFLLLRD